MKQSTVVKCPSDESEDVNVNIPFVLTGAGVDLWSRSGTGPGLTQVCGHKHLCEIKTDITYKMLLLFKSM